MPTALLITLGAFALMMILVRLKVPLAAAIFAGTVALGLAFGLSIVALLGTLLAGLVAPRTVGIVVITTVLLVLSHLMREAGQLDEIVDHVKAVLRRPAVAMAAIPALIGLLPMPGGALFSAPMVAAAAGRRGGSGPRLSAINYWFRHIWEFWWPLYPGVLLALGLTGIPLETFALLQLPLGVMMAAAGLLLLRGLHPSLRTAAARPPAGAKRRLLRATSSIWLILLVWLAGVGLMRLAFGPPPAARRGGPALPAGQQWLTVAHSYGPIALGLLVSVAWTLRRNRMKPASARAALGSKQLVTLLALVAVVMMFGHLLGAVNAADGIAADLTALRVPPLVVIVALPAIAGLVTGLAIGFVGASMPIVLGIVAAMGEVPLAPYVALAYGFGHLGMMLSPLHLCQILSNQYFGAGFAPVYRRLLAAGIAQGAGVAGYFLLLRWALG